MILLIGGETAGTGKTTLAANLAARLSAQGAAVILVDTDKQGHAKAWARIRDENGDLPKVSSVYVSTATLEEEIQKLAGDYDEVVIDASSCYGKELQSAMLAADQLLIPVLPSPYDVGTTERTDEHVSQARGKNAAFKAVSVINRASAHPHSHESNNAREGLGAFNDVPFSGVVVHDRVAFRRAMSAGGSVWEMMTRDPNACAEMDAVYAAIYSKEASLA